MNKKNKILLIGNYTADQQESMKRFHHCLKTNPHLPTNIVVESLSPTRHLASGQKSTLKGVNKFLAYLDKFILFSFSLWLKSRHYDLVHISDHSNAIYCFFTRKTKTLVTCHDVLAIEAAMGVNNHCPTSYSGRYLQKLITWGLRKANHIVAVSQTTKDGLHSLIPHNQANHLHRIYNGHYQSLDAKTAVRPSRLAEAKQFIFHVGSNLDRKNRDGIIRAFAQANLDENLYLVFAGKTLSNKLQALAKELQCDHLIIDLGVINRAELSYLYANALALIFPSHSEGFGVPIIEAIEMNCPIITSNWSTFLEILPRGYPHCSSTDIAAISQSIRSVQDPQYRQNLQDLIANKKSLFTTSTMQKQYAELYQKILS